MSRRDEYGIDKLRRAEARRQAILDYLLANPWCGFDQLVSGLQALPHPPHGITPVNMRGAIANMTKKREIAASGSPRNRSYIAVAARTETAEAIRQSHLDRQKRNNLKNSERYSNLYRERKAAKDAEKQARATPKPTTEPWRTVHRSGDIPEITKNQRGQGAVRARVFVNCYTLF